MYKVSPLEMMVQLHHEI